MSFQAEGPAPAGRAPISAYNPAYDPLVSPPGRGQDYAPTYWVATAGAPPEDDGPVTGDIDADVVIVGSGFTGLSAALALARDYGVKAVVLEANRAVWGCTSRNGGQGQNASGRLYRSQWIARWGLDTAKRLDAEIHEGFDYWKSLVAQVDCDAQPGGHLYTAHRQKKMAFLENESRVMREVFGYDARMLSQGELRERYVNDREAVGAMLEPDGVGVHPLKLAYGYMRQARALGVRIHPGSPVLGWRAENGGVRLQTPGGYVRARRVAFATGGYTAQGVNRLLDNRIMPVLSNSLVTRVLTPAERDAAGLKSTVFITDTRTLRFYYRLLPDGRMQIGSRSALRGADAQHPRHLALLRRGLAREWGIRGLGVLPADRRMRDVLAAQDGLYTLISEHPDGSCKARVIGSIVDYRYAPDDPAATVELLAAPETRVITLTITEGGYCVRDRASAFGLIVEALVRRRDRGSEEFAAARHDLLLVLNDSLRHRPAYARTA